MTKEAVALTPVGWMIAGGAAVGLATPFIWKGLLFVQELQMWGLHTELVV